MTPRTGRPPHDVLSPDGNLARFLHHQALLRPDTPALVFPKKSGDAWADDVVTFRALDEDGRRLAASFRASGLAIGDHVLLLVPPSRELYVAMVGVVAAGGVAVFVDPWMPRARIDEAIAAVKPTVFIGVARAHLLRLVSPATRRIARKILVGDGNLTTLLAGAERFHELVGSAPAPVPIAELPGDAPCIITFTSGTTGTPKGAVRTHKLLATQGDALDHALPREPGDVDLATLPIFALVAVSQGVPSVFAAVDDGDVSRFDPAVVVDQLARHRITGLGGSPAFLLRLARHVRGARVDLPALRVVTVGGAPAGTRLLRILLDAFPGAAVHVLYGSTEAEPVASVDARDIVDANGRGCCVGRPHEGLEVRIVRPETDLRVERIDDVALPRGSIGEIVVAGPVVLERYIDARDTERTKITDAAGRRWHRMGDLGHVDDDGRIWLHGRAGESISTAHGPLHPLDVEPVVEALDEVEKAGLVPHAGGALLALVPARAVSEDRLLAAVQDALAAAELPVDDIQLTVVKDIPVDKRHRARVDRAALRAQVAS